MEFFLLSEGEEQLGKGLVEYISAHFPGSSIGLQYFNNINHPQEVETILGDAGDKGAVVVHSFLDGELRAEAKKQAWKLKVPLIDLLGPLLSKISPPEKSYEESWRVGGVPSLEHNYYKKIEAIEFAVRCDDGKDLSALARADLVLLGISRTSKTPLSIYLAHLGYKVANVPLVPEVIPPRELFTLPREKIVGLTIDPEVLRSIRKERLRVIKMPTADYSNLERIYRELEFGKGIMAKIGCLTLEVTGRSLEELATLILEKGEF